MNTSERRREKFPGIKLSPQDANELAIKSLDKTQPARTWRRMKILQLLNDGWKIVNIGKAFGMYPREIRRVGIRYVEKGLAASLDDEPRPKPSKMFDHRSGSMVIAIACESPPQGRAQWTCQLLAEEVVKRGIVPKVSDETIRQLLKAHDLKPWRKKNVVCSET